MAQAAKPAESESDPYKRELAARIYKALDDFNRRQGRGHGLSQAELGARLARRLGKSEPIPQATVSRWMNEKSPSAPDNLTLRAMAQELDCDLLWLLYGQEPARASRVPQERPAMTDAEKRASAKRRA